MTRLKAWAPTIIWLLSLVFAGGVSWNQYDTLKGQTKANTETIDRLANIIASTYVRQDVNKVQLDTIQRDITEIKQLLQAQNGSLYGRRFDR